jgi:5-dehydro-2-deoxygluconokinase
VDVFLPNLDEAGILTDGADPKKMAAKLLARGCREVIIKLGADGSLAANENGIFQEDAFSVRVVDTTAAGDAFNAAMVYGLIQGWEINRRLRFANALAAIVVSRLDDRYPALAEVDLLMKKVTRE